MRVRVPALECRRVGQDDVGQRGLLAVADVDGHVEGDEGFVREHLARHVGLREAIGRTQGERHVRAHLLATLTDVGVDHLATPSTRMGYQCQESGYSEGVASSPKYLSCQASGNAATRACTSAGSVSNSRVPGFQGAGPRGFGDG